MFVDRFINVLFVALYDDRAVAIERNTGRVLGGEEV